MWSELKLRTQSTKQIVNRNRLKWKAPIIPRYKRVKDRVFDGQNRGRHQFSRPVLFARHARELNDISIDHDDGGGGT